MESQDETRRLAAILCADVVGYSRQMGVDEAGTLARLNAHRNEIIDPKIAEHHGRIVKLMGDGILVEFASIVDAVRCAVDVQQAMARRNADVSEDRRMEFRIGINLGDIIVEDADIYGDGVNVAARLQEVAEPGGICISGKVFEEVKHKLSVGFEDIGPQAMKNISEPVHTYMVRLERDQMDAMPSASQDAVLARPAVAVLPFNNLSGDPGQEYFTDGLTEDIITALAAWQFFPVIARNSTFVYKGKAVDVKQIARELGARYVLEGSIRKGGNRLRITAQLIDAATGLHIWAERYDRELEDIFSLQDEIAQRIAATMEPELERAEYRRIVSGKPKNLDAWDYCRRGNALLNEFTKEGNEQARQMFERALELDSTYSQAHCGLAQTHHRDINLDLSESREESVAKCLEAARRAVKLDDMDSSAHWMLGLALQWAGQYELAVAAAERATQINPSNAQAHVSLGTALAFAGRHEAGIASIERGLQLNPQDPRSYLFTAILARTHLNARNHKEAMEVARKAIQRKSDHPLAYIYLAASLGHLGRQAEARAALDECERAKPGYVENWIHRQSAEATQVENQHILDGLRKAGLPEKSGSTAL